MVLSTALFGKPAFRNLICNGLVLAEDGKKMSKSLKNYPSPLEVIDDYGAVSYYLILVSVVFFFFFVCVMFHQLGCSDLFFNFRLLKCCFSLMLRCMSYCLCAGCFTIVPHKLPSGACRALTFQKGRSSWCCEYCV